MLVLSRKAGEEIVIGDNIRLVVSRIAGNRVALGIAAPDDVHITRGELTLPHVHIEQPATADDNWLTLT